MKKRFVWMGLLLICLLCSCGTIDPGNDGLAILTDIPTTTPEFISTKWKDAYVEALFKWYSQDMEQNNFSEPDHFTLIDLNLDGNPELIFFYMSGRGRSFAFATYTYQKGKVYFVKFREDENMRLPGCFELYRDICTGELKWIARTEICYSTCCDFYYEFYDFSDLLHPKSELFFSYLIDYKESDEGEYKISTTNDVKMSSKEIEEGLEKIMDSFDALSFQTQFKFTDTLFEDGKRTFNRKKLNTFFDEWVPIEG